MTSSLLQVLRIKVVVNVVVYIVVLILVLGAGDLSAQGDARLGHDGGDDLFGLLAGVGRGREADFLL